jgi:hypothetical protein
MPFNFDLSAVKDKPSEVKVNPIGWRNPITVEYVIAQAHPYDTTVSVIWRVKGTEHCFTIGEQKLNQISHANYPKHFEEVLANFRIDYLHWFTNPLYKDADWKYEYERQFSKFILPEGNESNQGTSQ